MIPTAPLRVRNRLAELILAAVEDDGARRALARLAADAEAARAWLGPEDAAHAALVQLRARRAAEALATLPARPAATRSLAGALEAAAALFDAGLGFEVHELLEPHWSRAEGGRRQALQGLIQVAVGFQHRANGNGAGARALLAEGVERLRGQRLEGLDLEAFARAVSRRLADGGPELAGAGGDPPPFPRRPQGRD